MCSAMSSALQVALTCKIYERLTFCCISIDCCKILQKSLLVIGVTERCNFLQRHYV